jgi:hypothetical protein
MPSYAIAPAVSSLMFERRDSRLGRSQRQNLEIGNFGQFPHPRSFSTEPDNLLCRDRDSNESDPDQEI